MKGKLENHIKDLSLKAQLQKSEISRQNKNGVLSSFPISRFSVATPSIGSPSAKLKCKAERKDS